MRPQLEKVNKKPDKKMASSEGRGLPAIATVYNSAAVI